MKNIRFFAFLTAFFIVNTLGVYTLLLTSGCQTTKSTNSGDLSSHGGSSREVTGALTKADSSQDPGFISNSKQMTFVGPRAGEGYFSQDGKQMVFQSERHAGNPFYQIYFMNLETGKTDLVSPGPGKTTCAWIHPNGKKVMFSSTHLDKGLEAKIKEEHETRKSPQKGKYSWSYDEYFDVFEYDTVTKKYKQLTKDLGYDAEGSYSPDGQWIAFASNRSGYTEKLSAEDQKIFSQDPSYMMDIYIMKADGTQVKQLTQTKGYDGGPFFSADGQKITWRRFTPNGQIAEVWTMNLDGSDQKQITKINAMSWAPYFHPSGDYLIFTSNKLGYSNFELFIVDTEGKKDPVRVSFVDGFDGLPVFSPDGTKISWTHRNEKGDSQIFIGDWNDDLARKALGLSQKPLEFKGLSANIQESDAKKIVTYLASDSMNGRKTGSPEELIYTAKLKSLFEEMGLKAEFQEYEFTSGVQLGAKEKMVLKTSEGELNLKVGVDYTPLSFAKNGDYPLAEVVFAGYGIIAPANDKQPLFDSYKDLDVKGKWVLAFRDIPEGISNEKRIHLNMYSRPHHKALVARQAGAIGLILVNGPNSQTTQKLMKLKYDGANSESGIPVLSISDEMGEKLLKTSGRTLKKWQDVLDTGEIQNTPLKDMKASAQVDLIALKSKGRNVLAELIVNPKASFVMIGAHGDHLGRGDGGSSLAKKDEQGMIHYGADDNASGVAGVLELAHFFSDQKKKGKSGLKQNLRFAVWSGEEIGILGSNYYVKNMKSKPTVYLNMDMIGRYRESLSIQSVGSAKEWKTFIERQGLKSNISLTTQDDPYLPTDSIAFYLKEIPSVSLFTGAHVEYHSPRDRAELINYPGLILSINFLKDLVTELGSSTQTQLTYQKVEGQKSKLEGRTFRIYLGTIPDYSQEGVKGVRISGTAKESPAEAAGLKQGDVIIELAGTKIENLYDYVYCLQSMKANQPTKIIVSRSGKNEEMTIVPKLKE